MRLGSEVVDFVRLDGSQNPSNLRSICQVAVMQKHSSFGVVWITVEMVDSLGVECRSSTNDAVNFISLFQQEVGQMRTILACDAGD